MIIDKIVLTILALLGFVVIFPLGCVAFFSVFLFVVVKFAMACAQVGYEFVVK
jgi:hypothetical protein